MSKRTLEEYRRRIDLARRFIDERLDQALKLDDIARASHFSRFHFHRIFHSLVGETVNDYVHRKKMERAVRQLLGQRHKNITTIAIEGGFSSSANFSKAFKHYFGVSPTQARDPQLEQDRKTGKIFRKYGKAFNVQDLYSQTVTDAIVFAPEQLEEIFMNVEIKYMPERQIAYLTAPCGYELNAIFATWDRIIHWARTHHIPDQENRRYAICHDNPMITPTEQCRYDASIELDRPVNVEAPFMRSAIPAGQYAVAHYRGEGDKVSQFYMELYSAWLPDSGYEPDDFPPVAHYLNDSRQDGFVDMNVYIKVRALTTA